jgi:hypothetical protein
MLILLKDVIRLINGNRGRVTQVVHAHVRVFVTSERGERENLNTQCFLKSYDADRERRKE